MKTDPEAAKTDDIDLAQCSAMIFGTPMIAYRWPETEGLNQSLREVILAKERESKGLARSNVGGWHSDTDFFNWDVECVRALRSRVEQITIALTRTIMLTPDGPRRFNYRLDGWANVGRRGSYNTVHNHPNCLWPCANLTPPGTTPT